MSNSKLFSDHKTHQKCSAFITGIIFTFSFVCIHFQAQSQPTTLPPLSLDVGVILAEEKPTLGPTLIFCVTNNTKEDMIVDDAGVGGSPIGIIKPDGSTISSVVYAERTPPLPRLKPKQVSIQKMNLFELFTRERLNTPGIYKVFWRTTPHGSKAVYYSNELVVVREKTTPIMDPTTGRFVEQNE